MNRWNILLVGLLTPLIIFGVFFLKFQKDLALQLSEKKFLIPTQFFSAPTTLKVGQIFKSADLMDLMDQHRYKQIPFGQPLRPGEYSTGQWGQCQRLAQFSDQSSSCLAFRHRHRGALFVLTQSDWDEVLNIFNGEEMLPAQSLTLEPRPFAQFVGDKPAFQIPVSIENVPRFCIDALLAIEDPGFLDHRGLAPKAIARAVWANLTKGFGAQGGSTITQQLVKNYFLSSEKTLKRKIHEMFLSLALEAQSSKTEILETYMNIVYLGQQGHLAVSGWGSAAQYYFEKPLGQLQLGECASLAAILNNPGHLNPWTHAEAFQARKNKVLSKMLAQQRISATQYNKAVSFQPTPTENRQLSSPAPYFIDAVKDFLTQKKIPYHGGATVYTTIDLFDQRAGEKAVKDILPLLQKRLNTHDSPLSNSLLPSSPLEVAFLSADPTTGGITSLIGGSNYRTRPFNRALLARRPIGSLIKPLVYLNGMLKKDDQGQPLFHPLSAIENSPLIHRYEGQVWQPKNYDRTHSPPVPYFYALKESLNIPTARVALSAGLEPLAQLLEDLVDNPSQKREFQPLPALSLGVSELSPKEVLQVYSTLSNGGIKNNLYLVEKVIDRDGKEVFSHSSAPTSVFPKQVGFTLIAMMKEVMKSGTARSASRLGFTHHSAGKTGTTSQGRDSWFAGFSTSKVAVAWVGKDENTKTSLVGSSAALPIWTHFMKQTHLKKKNMDFPWPENFREITLPSFELEEWQLPEHKRDPVQLWLPFGSQDYETDEWKDEDF